MRSATVNVDSLNIGSILWVISFNNERKIGKINGIIRRRKGYEVSVVDYNSSSEFIKFKEINPVTVTDNFLTDNFDKDKHSDLWGAKLGDNLGIEIFKSPDDRYDNYIFNLFDNDLHTYGSIEFIQVHQLQNILNYFNVEYKLDISSYIGSK